MNNACSLVLVSENHDRRFLESHLIEISLGALNKRRVYASLEE